MTLKEPADLLPSPRPDQEPYPFEPITDRPDWPLPGGARVAFYVGLNIEHFRRELPVEASQGAATVNPMARGWRDYGNRVGFWRLLDLFDDLGIRISALVNSDVCTLYPQIIDAGVARDWSWVAHGQTNSVFMEHLGPEEERRHLSEMFSVLDKALPARPTGWLGPGLSETSRTLGILEENGVDYVLDWCCDDQPVPMTTPGMLSVPYSIDVNDYVLFMSNPGLTGPDYERIVLDQLEQLLSDSSSASRVMALPLHTFITGQPFRTKYLARVLREVLAMPEVWVCTSDDVAQHYRQARREQ